MLEGGAGRAAALSSFCSSSAEGWRDASSGGGEKFAAPSRDRHLAKEARRLSVDGVALQRAAACNGLGR